MSTEKLTLSEYRRLKSGENAPQSVQNQISSAKMTLSQYRNAYTNAYNEWLKPQNVPEQPSKPVLQSYADLSDAERNEINAEAKKIVMAEMAEENKQNSAAQQIINAKNQTFLYIKIR